MHKIRVVVISQMRMSELTMLCTAKQLWTHETMMEVKSPLIKCC